MAFKPPKAGQRGAIKCRGHWHTFTLTNEPTWDDPNESLKYDSTDGPQLGLWKATSWILEKPIWDSFSPSHKQHWEEMIGEALRFAEACQKKDRRLADWTEAERHCYVLAQALKAKETP